MTTQSIVDSLRSDQIDVLLETLQARRVLALPALTGSRADRVAEMIVAKTQANLCHLLPDELEHRTFVCSSKAPPSFHEVKRRVSSRPGARVLVLLTAPGDWPVERIFPIHSLWGWTKETQLFRGFKGLQEEIERHVGGETSKLDEDIVSLLKRLPPPDELQTESVRTAHDALLGALQAMGELESRVTQALSVARAWADLSLLSELANVARPDTLRTLNFLERAGWVQRRGQEYHWVTLASRIFGRQRAPQSMRERCSQFLLKLDRSLDTASARDIEVAAGLYSILVGSAEDTKARSPEPHPNLELWEIFFRWLGLFSSFDAPEPQPDTGVLEPVKVLAESTSFQVLGTVEIGADSDSEVAKNSQAGVALRSLQKRTEILAQPGLFSPMFVADFLNPLTQESSPWFKRRLRIELAELAFMSGRRAPAIVHLESAQLTNFDSGDSVGLALVLRGAELAWLLGLESKLEKLQEILQAFELKPYFAWRRAWVRVWSAYIHDEAGISGEENPSDELKAALTELLTTGNLLGGQPQIASDLMAALTFEGSRYCSTLEEARKLTSLALGTRDSCLSTLVAYRCARALGRVGVEESSSIFDPVIDAHVNAALPAIASLEFARLLHEFEISGNVEIMNTLSQWVRNDGLKRPLTPLACCLFRRTEATAQLDTPGRARKADVTVNRRGYWFRVGTGDVVDLAGRQPLRRILRRLLKAYREAPGVGLSVEELQSAGWPEESMTATSGRNRVYATIRLLRDLGLEDFLLTGDAGYYLDSSSIFKIRDITFESVRRVDDSTPNPR